MNKLKGLISTPRLPSLAGNFNRGTLIHNGVGRDSPECVFGEPTQPGKFQVKDKDLESEDSMMNLYERWMRVFGIFRIHPEEKNRRFNLFKENVQISRSANMLSDMTLEEVIRERTGFTICSVPYMNEEGSSTDSMTFPGKTRYQRGLLGMKPWRAKKKRTGEPTNWERLSKEIRERGGLGCNDETQLVCAMSMKGWCTCQEMKKTEFKQ
ncbi:hypothetical protein MKW94_015696 [Papaver nudicaule]|uniref:Cathepsin propeptide inhibitor domain-containing protein n=1 Tax=Papaver nudicaule TaxID=74823 RepID=A0AA42B367_PAPNU|nr:hypothetical protein [Papaver nudicaule]MCL7049394.1 hypothetical protein [Papaver nudicaule]